MLKPNPPVSKSNLFALVQQQGFVDWFSLLEFCFLSTMLTVARWMHSHSQIFNQVWPWDAAYTFLMQTTKGARWQCYPQECHGMALLIALPSNSFHAGQKISCFDFWIENDPVRCLIVSVVPYQITLSPPWLSICLPGSFWIPSLAICQPYQYLWQLPDLLLEWRWCNKCCNNCHCYLIVVFLLFFIFSIMCCHNHHSKTLPLHYGITSNAKDAANAMMTSPTGLFWWIVIFWICGGGLQQPI